MGDGVVNELITFFVFLYVETVEKEKEKTARTRKVKRCVAVTKKEGTDLCRHLAVQIEHPNENGRVHRSSIAQL